MIFYQWSTISSKTLHFFGDVLNCETSSWFPWFHPPPMMDGGTSNFGRIMMGGITGIFSNVGGTGADGGS